MPSNFTHARLGPLSFDSDLNWYTSDRRDQGLGQLQLSLDDCSDEAAFLDRVASRLSGLLPEIERAKQVASAELLHPANTEWLPDGGEQNDAAAFVEKLSVESVVFYPDDQFDVIFRAGDLFAGHGVIASVRLDEPTSVDLCG